TAGFEPARNGQRWNSLPFSTQACQSSSARGTGVCASAARGSAFAASTTRVTTASRLMKPPSSFEPPGKRRRNPSGRATQQGHEGHGPERLALDPRLAPREANQLLLALGADRHDEPPPDPQLPDESRSEERRVGKECRCRWSRYHEKKKR